MPPAWNSGSFLNFILCRGDKKCPDMYPHSLAMRQSLRNLPFLGGGLGVPPLTQEGPQVLFLPSPQLGVRIQALLSSWATGILTLAPIVLAMGSMDPLPPWVPHIISPLPSLALGTGILEHRCFDSFFHPRTVKSGILVVSSPGSKPGVSLSSPKNPRGLPDVVCPPTSSPRYRLLNSGYCLSRR